LWLHRYFQSAGSTQKYSQRTTVLSLGNLWSPD